MLIQNIIVKILGRRKGIRLMKTKEIEEYISCLKNLSSCVISDAMDKIGLKSVMNSSIRPIKSGITIAGQVVTVKSIKKEKIIESDYSKYTNILNEVTDGTEPGKIIIIDADGDTECASWGGNRSLAAKLRKIGGVIIDGAARDYKEITEMDFPVFCKNTIPPKSKDRLITIDYNVPVVCGGILIHPGDFIIGDDDGVVVIPANRISEILVLAEEIENKERKIVEYLKAGHKFSEAVEKFK